MDCDKIEGGLLTERRGWVDLSADTHGWLKLRSCTLFDIGNERQTFEQTNTVLTAVEYHVTR